MTRVRALTHTLLVLTVLSMPLVAAPKTKGGTAIKVKATSTRAEVETNEDGSLSINFKARFDSVQAITKTYQALGLREKDKFTSTSDFEAAFAVFYTKAEFVIKIPLKLSEFVQGGYPYLSYNADQSLFEVHLDLDSVDTYYRFVTGPKFNTKTLMGVPFTITVDKLERHSVNFMQEHYNRAEIKINIKCIATEAPRKRLTAVLFFAPLTNENKSFSYVKGINSARLDKPYQVNYTELSIFGANPRLYICDSATGKVEGTWPPDLMTYIP